MFFFSFIDDESEDDNDDEDADVESNLSFSARLQTSKFKEIVLQFHRHQIILSHLMLSPLSFCYT